MEVLERHVRRLALVHCMETGDRYIECLKSILATLRLETRGQDWAKQIFKDYKEYDKKMREAGMK